MKRVRTHGIFTFIVVTVASCGGGGGAEEQLLNGTDGNLTGAGVQLTTEKTIYRGGDPVELTIQNRESVSLAYNACTRKLEVRAGLNWVPGPESLRLCSREVWYVDGGAVRLDTADLDLGLTPGDYRLVLSFTSGFAPEAAQISAVTNPFTIVP